MIRVIADVGKNRLVFELSGSPTNEEADGAERELRSGLTRLRPPIDLMADVSQLDSLELILPVTFERMNALLQGVVIRKVVRVVGRSTEGARQLQRMMRSFGHAAHLAFSRDEAETVLSKR